VAPNGGTADDGALPCNLTLSDEVWEELRQRDGSRRPNASHQIELVVRATMSPVAVPWTPQVRTPGRRRRPHTVYLAADARAELERRSAARPGASSSSHEIELAVAATREAPRN
jgi:hypothetical protein